MKLKFLFISFIGAILVIFFFCFCTSRLNKATLKKNTVSLTYLNEPLRNENKTVMKDILKDNSIAILGSSELSSADTVGYPPYLFNYGNSDYNTILIGQGHNQSLFHSILVGAYQDIIPNKKIVLIVSPQWFTKDGNPSAAFASRFSERLYIDFMKNPNIPVELKRTIAEKVKSALITNESEKNRVEKIDSIYIKQNAGIFYFFTERLFEHFMLYKNNFLLTRKLQDVKTPVSDRMVFIDNIDFNNLMNKALNVAVKESDNNPFYIDNIYYNTYVHDNLEIRKNASDKESYAVSPEYDDFLLFLEVCEVCDISPLVISVPVHGMWYDWSGFSKKQRDIYYEKIRDICAEKQVALADFSEKEYEPYFLRDIMHLGWKGWVYLDEAVYNFYKDK